MGGYDRKPIKLPAHRIDAPAYRKVYMGYEYTLYQTVDGREAVLRFSVCQSDSLISCLALPIRTS